MVTLFLTTLSYGQSYQGENYVEKSFLIVHSSENYKSAEQAAIQAAEKLGLDLVEQTCKPDSINGFVCELCTCSEVHDYFPRGSYDDGIYVSVEYSDYYKGFAEGYYIVIVANGDRKDIEVVLKDVKRVVQEAYIKDSKVYMGCMH